jgi:hypothetical protein
MKNQDREIISFEKKHTISTNTNFKISLETPIAT